LKTKKAGLCIYHDKAVRLVRILIGRRALIHQKCLAVVNFAGNSELDELFDELQDLLVAILEKSIPAAITTAALNAK
jgi:hypothetical protein